MFEKILNKSTQLHTHFTNFIFPAHKRPTLAAPCHLQGKILKPLVIKAASLAAILLLLSLSEHVSFALAYAAAATACIGLIAVYAKAVLGGWGRALPTAVALSVLYGVLHLVLQSEQHALLVGSLLLFAVPAGVMLMTRHLQWGQLNGKP